MPAVGVQVPLIEYAGIAKANDVTLTDRLDAELVSVPLTAGIGNGSPAFVGRAVARERDRRAAEVEHSSSVTAVLPSGTGTTPGMSESVAVSATLVELRSGASR